MSNLEEKISQHIKMKSYGNVSIGLCPFHKELTPSFTANSSLDIWHCFGCGVQGRGYESFKEKLDGDRVTNNNA